MSKIDALIKQSANEEVKIEKEKDSGNLDILEYLEKKYKPSDYNADFCQYKYKWGNLYCVNFWREKYKDGNRFPTNSLFRRILLKVTETPDGFLTEIDLDEGDS